MTMMMRTMKLTSCLCLCALLCVWHCLQCGNADSVGVHRSGGRAGAGDRGVSGRGDLRGDEATADEQGRGLLSHLRLYVGRHSAGHKR
jgi:hypothetical protein